MLVNRILPSATTLNTVLAVHADASSKAIETRKFPHRPCNATEMVELLETPNPLVKRRLFTFIGRTAFGRLRTSRPFFAQGKVDPVILQLQTGETEGAIVRSQYPVTSGKGTPLNVGEHLLVVVVVLVLVRVWVWLVVDLVGILTMTFKRVVLDAVKEEVEIVRVAEVVLADLLVVLLKLLLVVPDVDVVCVVVALVMAILTGL